MFNRLKKIIKSFIPPIIFEYYVKLKQGNFVEFSGVYKNEGECPDENPWVQPAWIRYSRSKLERIQSQGFEFTGYITLVTLIINLLSNKQMCRVLDFGGGTGFVYFRVFPYLLNKANIQWNVFERNEPLSLMGQEFARKDKNYNINFYKDLPKSEETRFDVVYLNSVLQYICEYEVMLKDLLVFKPKYVILTRLATGDMPTYITCQNLDGHRTPFIFVNFNDLQKVFNESGYELVSKTCCVEEIFTNRYDSNIPEAFQIPDTMNVIFASQKR